MLVRRGFYWAQFGAVIVLPLWLLIGRGLVFSGSGWAFVMLLIVAPILFVYMGLILGLTLARKSVRATKAVSWIDVALLAVWWLVLIAAGFVRNDGIAAIAILISIGAFWLQLWQLIRETRDRFNAATARLTDSYPVTPNPDDPPRIIRIDQ
ncbi:MFS transporter [Cryobacterium sp. BB736]|uniref:MFS transporter n=1 Tax=Cryobacterium sp. BB736 TaxID=2746963 RepID=UPI0018749712|nr:MFS transporter [Cryobacterium sp. BB736]